MAGALLALSAALLAGGAAQPVGAEDTPAPVVFQVPGTYTWTVPAGVDRLAVDALGGYGGGPVIVSPADSPSGGRGGEVRAVVPVTPGDTLTVIVGGKGSATGGGYGGGPGRGDGGATVYYPGGGGASSVLDGDGGRLVVAGGGGGGYGVTTNFGVTTYGTCGGDGGGNGTPDGQAGCSTTSGRGGTQTAGGGGGLCPSYAGAAATGADGGASHQWGGGSGGGGYWGGGGGCTDLFAPGPAGGGGGGSSYATPDTIGNPVFGVGAPLDAVDLANDPNAGNGHVILTPWVGVDAPTVPTGALPADPLGPTETEGGHATAEQEEFYQELLEVPAADYAGAEILPDGTVRFGLVDDAPIPPELAQRTDARIVRRRHSTAELRGALDAAGEALDADYHGWVAVADNVAWFQFDRDMTPEQELQAAAVLVPFIDQGLVKVHPERTDIAFTNLSCASPLDCSPSFRGGTHTWNVTPDGGCTLGFVLRNPDTGIRYHSTAGHCMEDQDGRFDPKVPYWNHAARGIGQAVFYADQSTPRGWVDLLIIEQFNDLPQEAPSNLIYRDGNTATRIDKKVLRTKDTELVGNIVCQEGSRSTTRYNVSPRQRCGKITTLHSKAKPTGGASGFGEFDAVACRGDSGGPVVADSTNRAYGFVRSATVVNNAKCGSPVRFTWSAYPDAIWRNQLLLLKPTSESLGGGQKMSWAEGAATTGAAIVSTDGRFSARMQEDGNFVLNQQGVGTLWASSWFGARGDRIIMQTDGNLVLKSGNTVTWATATFIDGSYLKVENNGNMVVYGPGGGALWSTNTGGH